MQWLKDLIEKAETIYYDPRAAERAVWLVITALRGPDYFPLPVGNIVYSNRESLKHITTARIRAIVGVNDTGYALRNSTPLSDVQITKRFDYLKDNRHFRQHTSWAYEELKKLGYDIPEKEMDFIGLP